jgi:hypothetical protein
MHDFRGVVHASSTRLVQIKTLLERLCSNFGCELHRLL